MKKNKNSNAPVIISAVHENFYMWGFCLNIIAENGAGTVEVEFENGKDHSFVSGLSVLKSRRNQGIGSALLEECERVSGYNKRYAVELEIEAQDQYAQEFYEKMGYKVVDKFVLEYGEYKLMRKEINPNGDYF